MLKGSKNDQLAMSDFDGEFLKFFGFPKGDDQ
jgi:hypothetical protein